MLQLKEDAGQVVLRIIDSGTRISPEVEKKMFQPFFTTKPVGQGTGLGLSIVKGILDEHQATIELVTDTTHTCFEIRFPKSEEKGHSD
jgi:signal transduction histidine kinase